MIKISLKLLDVNNYDDQVFLYDVLKFRWDKSEIINVKYRCSDVFPTFEQHVSYITSGKYKVFYKVYFGDVTIGSVYIDKQDINGTIIIPSELKKALKRYKGEELEIHHTQISALIHIRLYELHPEIEIHYASVNPNNTLSMNALLENGYEHIESILAIKTKDGKIIQGKLKDFYEKPISNSR